jgi:hypothetical protein
MLTHPLRIEDAFVYSFSRVGTEARSDQVSTEASSVGWHTGQFSRVAQRPVQSGGAQASSVGWRTGQFR